VKQLTVRAPLHQSPPSQTVSLPWCTMNQVAQGMCADVPETNAVHNSFYMTRPVDVSSILILPTVSLPHMGLSISISTVGTSAQVYEIA
jgi:hypothetical protein